METINFLNSQIGQSEILAFAKEKVNLKQEHVDLYREKVRTLQSHLERYVSEHPDVGIVKMFLSGSLRKHTALKTINDVDLAVYVKGTEAPQELAELLPWFEEKLKKTYHQMPDASIRIDGPCVVITFIGLGVDIDVAPIHYDGNPQWKGYLWDRMSGERILTSIPQHIEFLKKRRIAHKQHFVQVIRLLKWWARQRSQDQEPLVIRSFLIELIMAKLADEGHALNDYHSSLEKFFQYVQSSQLKDRIAFSDYYALSQLPPRNISPVEIFDPVNPANNVASNITEQTRLLFLRRAEEALDALAFARTCMTKGEAIECWQDLMGSTFTA
jgi:hypothetical protein